MGGCWEVTKLQVHQFTMPLMALCVQSQYILSYPVKPDLLADLRADVAVVVSDVCGTESNQSLPFAMTTGSKPPGKVPFDGVTVVRDAIRVVLYAPGFNGTSSKLLPSDSRFITI